MDHKNLDEVQSVLLPVTQHPVGLSTRGGAISLPEGRHAPDRECCCRHPSRGACCGRSGSAAGRLGRAKAATVCFRWPAWCVGLAGPIGQDPEDFSDRPHVLIIKELDAHRDETLLARDAQVHFNVSREHSDVLRNDPSRTGGPRVGRLTRCSITGMVQGGE